jgi:hypothetical protein
MVGVCWRGGRRVKDREVPELTGPSLGERAWFRSDRSAVAL